LGDSSYILKSPLKNTNFSPTYADDLHTFGKLYH
jgi:hypothetical protein